MPSFDIKSEVDSHELTNAIDQSNRVIANRFDFKNANALYEIKENKLALSANEAFQLDQMIPILKENLAKRSIDLKALKFGERTTNNNKAFLDAEIIQGVSQEISKKIIRIVKDSKIKVQSSIQGESIRVSGKKRDQLQEIISLIKKQELEIPLQFVNFRD
tara:strand:+ start:658 stop:1140 length:483 start_codon:yes stop_codon:yes gene_type:complete